MKRLGLLGLFAATVALASPLSRESLVGHWHAVTPGEAGTMVNNMFFEANGVFHGTITAEGRDPWIYRGKWVLAGPWLHYEYVTPTTLKDRDRVLEVTNQHLIIENKSGEKRTYTRCDDACVAQQGVPADGSRPAGEPRR